MGQRVFIFGSCATRDAFEIIPNEYVLEGYICRSSLGSAFVDRPFELSLSELDPDGEMVSQFQKRMVEIDLSKDAARQIAGCRSSDIVIVDLIDERFQLLVSGGSIATFSVELQRSKPLERFPQITLIKADTDEHFGIWLKGVRRFADQIGEQGPRVVLNKVKWADRDVLGVEFAPAYIRQSNASLQRMYEAFEAVFDCSTIEYRNPFLADPMHKWGRSPFHYSSEIYAEFMAQLDDIVASVGGPVVKHI